MLQCILKQNSKFYRMYWINFAKKGFILGGYQGPYVSELLGFQVQDHHFTYPIDGNLHQSYKSNKGLFVSAYSNKIKYKRVSEENTTTQNLDARCLLNLMLPDTIQQPIAIYDNQRRFFQFPMSCYLLPLPLDRIEQLLTPIDNYKMQNEKHILIDCDDFGEGTVNICAFIANESIDIHSFILTTENTKSFIREEKRGTKKIALLVTFYEKHENSVIF